MSKKQFAAWAVVLALAPSAVQAKLIVDLTPAAPTSFTETGDFGGPFVVSNNTLQSTGTGVIDPFVRIQQTGQERGYNTSVSPPPLDDKQPSGGFTRALQLSEIPTVTINGIVYREFLLDVNQVANGNISMNQVQIFQSSADVGNSGFTLSEATATQNASISFPSATKVFGMSNILVGSPTSYEVQIDSNHGSGSGDLFLYVKDSDFTGGPNSFVTLFSQFGNPSGAYASNAGFEEWAILKGSTTAVPEPATLVMAFTGLVPLSLALLRRRRRSHVVTA